MKNQSVDRAGLFEWLKTNSIMFLCLFIGMGYTHVWGYLDFYQYSPVDTLSISDALQWAVLQIVPTFSFFIGLSVPLYFIYRPILDGIVNISLFPFNLIYRINNKDHTSTVISRKNVKYSFSNPKYKTPGQIDNPKYKITVFLFSLAFLLPIVFSLIKIQNFPIVTSMFSNIEYISYIPHDMKKIYFLCLVLKQIIRIRLIT